MKCCQWMAHPLVDFAQQSMAPAKPVGSNTWCQSHLMLADPTYGVPKISEAILKLSSVLWLPITSKTFTPVHVWWWILVDTRSSVVLFSFPNHDLSDLYVHLLQYLGQWSRPPQHPALLRCFAQNPPCWRSPHHLWEQQKVWNVLQHPVNRRSS